ncbi:p58 [Pseudomonas phage PaP2]|uniref:hypothetical protein n=1 Tax=Pseudomonas phage PaP2 TaxID=270673 RepID=UPI00003593EE|nr:hypothetical protein PaP2_gp58 [Pseudomonas phage PaP2]AAS89644.1 p58 [Pseudomonas phage PaP2]
MTYLALPWPNLGYTMDPLPRQTMADPKTNLWSFQWLILPSLNLYSSLRLILTPSLILILGLTLALGLKRN